MKREEMTQREINQDWIDRHSDLKDAIRYQREIIMNSRKLTNKLTKLFTFFCKITTKIFGN